MEFLDSMICFLRKQLSLSFLKPQRICKNQHIFKHYQLKSIFYLFPSYYSTYTINEHQHSTIYALATPPIKSGVAILRVSGDGVSDIIKEMIQPIFKKKELMELENRKLILCNIVDPIEKNKLDRGMCVYFKGPNSFTGQDILELNIHGSIAIIKALLKSLDSMNNISTHDFRLALPGEFIKRAFLNDKVDLTEVEGLNDLINSETEAQRKQALRHFSGEMKVLYEGWRAKIIDILALLEAYIDFGEDEELDYETMEQARNTASDLLNKIDYHLKDSRKGEILNNGIQVAIIGPPNAGKSSLLNYIAQQDLSIVSSIPGTTRDIVTGKIDLDGMPLVIKDTAGIREDTEDVIELEGVKRALKSGDQSDLKLVVLDGKELLRVARNKENIFKGQYNAPNYENKEHTIISLLGDNNMSSLYRDDTSSKADKLPLTALLINKCEDFNPLHEKILMDYLNSLNANLINKVDLISYASCKTGSGLDSFLKDLSSLIKKRFEVSENEPIAIAHERHRIHLRDTYHDLKLFLELSDINYSDHDIVLAAEHLRRAATSLARITGNIEHEEVLDKLFSSFCIGK